MTFKLTHWEEVPLKRVLTYLDDRVELDDAEEYVTITVKRRHGGLEEREKLFGHQIKTKKQFRLVPAAFIIARVQCWHQAYAVVPDSVPPNMIASTNYDQFSVSPDVDRRFFWWLSHSPRFTEAVRSSAVGVVIEKMVFDRDAWLEKTIPFPSLPEQRRIVARIEELAAKINEARSLRKKAAQEAGLVFDSFLKSVFDGRAEINHWPSRLLPEVALVARGKFAHRPRNEPRFYSGKYPFIQIGDISSSNRYIRSYSQSLNEDGFAISRLFPAGTVVIAITGATIGVTGILSFDACFPDSIVGIQAKPELMTPDFIYLAVEHAKRVALAEATQTTQPNINLGNLERLKVYVPTLQEQRRIVAELDILQGQLDALKNLQAKTAADLEALLPSILDGAFKGKL